MKWQNNYSRSIVKVENAVKQLAVVSLNGKRYLDDVVESLNNVNLLLLKIKEKGYAIKKW